VKETGSVALKPSNMSFHEAASVCDGWMLANNLIQAIDFSTPMKILVNGATGSIGSACVQLAKANKAIVTGVCRTKDFELIKRLVATNVIDYTKNDFTACGDTFDVVIDAVGRSSFFKCKKILNKNGIYFSTELGYLAQNLYLPFITKFLSTKNVKFPIPTDNQRDILNLKKLIEEGNFIAVIDRTYPLNDIILATKYVESEEKVGNVVIEIE
jgi:NADPH:quinone reductase-like Zn-dependent oxidoreductase